MSPRKILAGVIRKIVDVLATHGPAIWAASPVPYLIIPPDSEQQDVHQIPYSTAPERHL